jgi:hypothetical protein
MAPEVGAPEAGALVVEVVVEEVLEVEVLAVAAHVERAGSWPQLLYPVNYLRL